MSTWEERAEVARKHFKKPRKSDIANIVFALRKLADMVDTYGVEYSYIKIFLNEIYYERKCTPTTCFNHFYWQDPRSEKTRILRYVNEVFARFLVDKPARPRPEAAKLRLVAEDLLQKFGLAQLSDRHEQILEECDSSRRTIPQIAAACDCEERTIRDDLQLLEAIGRICRPNGRNGGYQAVKI